MPGERTPDQSPSGKAGSTDDEISLREHMQRQIDAQWRYADRLHNDQGAYFERVVDELRSQLDERYATQTKALDAAFASAEKAVQAALAAAETAVAKAETAADKRFECVSADTPILCADLVWRPAGDLLVGDELLAFDETPPSRSGRRFRRSVVTHNDIQRDALLLVTTSDGAVRCNRQHPWLVSRHNGGVFRWIEAADLRQGDRVSRPVDVWETDRSWEAGWLAGMYDGEGCLSVTPKQVQLTMSQRESPTSDLIASALKERLGHPALAYRYEPGGPSTPNNTEPFFHFMVATRSDVMKILGSVRPPRLLAKAGTAWEGRVIAGNERWSFVESVEGAGSGLIATLSTSTHTYLAGGFAMHNSVNEFRAQLADQSRTFITRDESLSRHDRNAEALVDQAKRHENEMRLMRERIDKDIGLINSRLDLAAGRGTGLTNAWGYLTAIIAAAVAVVGVVIAVTQ